MTTTSADPGSAITQVLVPSRVIGEGFGARTHRARSVPVPSMVARGAPGGIRESMGDTYPMSPGTHVGGSRGSPPGLAQEFSPQVSHAVRDFQPGLAILG